MLSVIGQEGKANVYAEKAKARKILSMDMKVGESIHISRLDYIDDIGRHKCGFALPLRTGNFDDKKLLYEKLGK